MDKQIVRYPIHIDVRMQHIEMQREAEIIGVGTDYAGFHAWLFVRCNWAETTMVPKTINIYATGDKMPASNGRLVGSVCVNDSHYFVYTER